MSESRSSSVEAQAQAVALLTRHANASTPTLISDGEMAVVLRTGAVPARFAHHLHIALDEADLMTLTDLVLSGVADYAGLAALAHAALDPEHPTLAWLDERVGL